MADTYDISTLLPTKTLQNILQHYGSPSFSTSAIYNATARAIYIHFMTGRVPTPAEFYYGTYLDRVGDTHKSLPLWLADRYLGYIGLMSVTASPYNYVYGEGETVLFNGARWPVGATFTPYQTTYNAQRLDPNPLATPDWMLDWSFSANKQAPLAAGNRVNLRAYRDSGLLTGPAAPTWFFLSDSTTLPNTTNHEIRDHTNTPVARVAVLTDGSQERRPMLIGTVGTLGSGADLELASGGGEFSDTVSPVSLRVLLQEPEPAPVTEPAPTTADSGTTSTTTV